MSNYETEVLVENLRNTFDALYRVPVPMIASIDGPALGGGLEMGNTFFNWIRIVN